MNNKQHNKNSWNKLQWHENNNLNQITNTLVTTKQNAY